MGSLEVATLLKHVWVVGVPWLINQRRVNQQRFEKLEQEVSDLKSEVSVLRESSDNLQDSLTVLRKDVREIRELLINNLSK